MVRVDKPYAFEGPDGTVGLLDLFEGRQQLVITTSCGSTTPTLLRR
jgi:predicted dithiol-disulfide oxidoreductase (DUF899 family)